jgi:hypothetical protein
VILLLWAMACVSGGGDAGGGGEGGPDSTRSTPAALWSPPPARNALVIVVDTTRADALRAAATPHVDQLRALGADVPRAWSAGTWTAPSVISMMTGMSVRAHGWDEPTGRLGRYPRLPPAPTLAEVLQNAGFTTHGMHVNPYLSEQLGFDRGFDKWRRSSDKAIPEQFRKLVASTWSKEGRHFAYVHFIGPHSPLRPSPEAAARHQVPPSFLEDPKGFNIGVAKRNRIGGARDAYTKGYHAVLEDTDARIGAVLDALGPHRAETLVVLTSDHGELLGEHERVGHGHHVWEALSHVPLIVDHPALEGGVETLPSALSNAALPDIVTRGLGIQHAWPVGLDTPLPLVSQREQRLAFSPDGRHKAAWDPDVSDAARLFDLQTDPGERDPAPDTDGAMAAARAAWEAATPPGSVSEDAVQLHPETMEQLRALGYLP